MAGYVTITAEVEIEPGVMIGRTRIRAPSPATL
jgi:hypothetical protein